MQHHPTAPSRVPVMANPEGDTQDPTQWTWVEASIWTKRMLAALDNGVTGGRWYSLMDKVTAPRTLAAAWKRVAAKKGAAGVDGIVEQYFDSIPKAPLLARVADKVSDGTLLDLVQRFLDQDILEGMHQWSPLAGVPQGSGLSPLLSNLYLHPLDRVVSHAGYVIVRYCDDLVLLCRTQADAEAALALVQTWMAQHGLRLHPEKTRIVDGSKGGDGFDFLGYRFAGGRRHVRPKSLMAVRDKIRQLTGRTRSGSPAQIPAELNPLLRGWFGYFKHARFTTFRAVAGFVRRRLRALLRKRDKRPGFGRTPKDHQRWPNAFFAAQGLFTLHEAYGRARQSR